MNTKKQKEICFGDNCFDYLRMFSALLIIMGHCVIHLNIAIPVWFDAILNSWVGLFCLFVLTGYLIPASLENSKSVSEYFKKRFLRLYPGLWIAFFLSLICIIVIGKEIRYSLKDISVWAIAQLTVFQFYTPATIGQYGVGNPNGALWTISMEIQMYVVIMLSWNWLKKQSTRMWIFLIGFALAMNIVFPYVRNKIPVMIFKLLNVTFLPYLYVFLIGMFCYKQRDLLIPILCKFFWLLLVVYCVWFLLDYFLLNFHFGHYTNVITGIMVSFLTISCGYRFGRHRIRNEVSYGLYIYHMIVINVFFMFGWTGRVALIFAVIIITYFLSFISCNLIEKPIIRKHR
ncbi:MAG: acyltransferase family protein [Lachnospiraceae bacterium]